MFLRNLLTIGCLCLVVTGMPLPAQERFPDGKKVPAWFHHSGKVSLSALGRQYVHSWTPSAGKRGSVLRSRLKVQYDIPESRFSPYLAIETFTWDTWQKTRHYVACNYNINKTFQLETYYLYYSIKNAPAEHIIGLGLNIYL